MPFFPLWAQQNAGIPTEYIGLLLGCYAGGELLATPFVGGIADRVGRRPVLLASTAGVGVGFLLLFFTRGAIAAAIVAARHRRFRERPSSDRGDGHYRRGAGGNLARAFFAMTRVMSNAGRIIGPALGALLALWSLHLVFFGAAATILIGARRSRALLPRRGRQPSAAKDDDDDDESLTALGAAFRDRRLAGTALADFRA